MPLANVGGMPIAYTDTGPAPHTRDASAILFGHGLMFGGWMFSPQIATLRHRYRCLTIDWRGQGETPATRSGYDMDTLTTDAVGLIRRLNVAPVHYVGLSMGGFVGLRLAARHGELLRSLTLLNTSADEEDPGDARRYRMLASAYQILGPRPLSNQILSRLFGPAHRARPEHQAVRDEWIGRLRRLRRGGVRKAVRGVADRASVCPELFRIATPTFVAAGEDDVATPVAKSRRIAAAISGARFEQISRCGHTSTLEQPRAVTGIIERFLSELTGTSCLN